MTPAAPRILVSRTDRIGDVVLTLPLCAMLRERLGASIIFLGRGYTRPVLECCDVVDEILDWEVVGGDPSDARRAIKDAGANVILHAFPRREIASAAKAAAVPLRVGTSHRWYHWYSCNALEHFGRRRSPLHEAQLNIRLARRLLGAHIPSLEELARRPLLRAVAPLPAAVERHLRPDCRTIVIHPRSRGSGREWPLDRWRALIDGLGSDGIHVLVTGSAEEGASLREWLDVLPPHAVDLTGQLTLAELITLLASSGGVVAAGTGPLHVAAALGVPTLGLFPATPPIHPGRWAPLGPKAGYLVARTVCESCRTNGSSCRCMEGITVASVRDRVLWWFGVSSAAGPL